MGVRTGVRPGLVTALAGALACVAGCSNEAPPRPQLVVIVDTDAPVPALLADRKNLSGDAAVDTLRIDAIALDGSNTAYDLRTFLAPGPDDWPISFGVKEGEAGTKGHVRLRMRAFRGQLATSGELSGISTLDPPSEVTLDRIVDLDLPAEGVRRVRVVLRGDCIGVRGSFATPPTTCVDADRPKGDTSEGIEEIEGDAPPTVVGTWDGAVEAPCAGKAPGDASAVCIPGGFSILGDLAFRGVGDGIFEQDGVPLRPIRLSPYFMDRTEVTVGRLRALVKAGLAEEPVMKGDPSIDFSEFCTWLGPDDDANDALPVNCVTHAGAAAVCAALGGALPTEAQWEHAARGRGRHWLYPWGNESPDTSGNCCVTSASRKGPPGIPTECSGGGIEPVGSHPATMACAEASGDDRPLGDESLDGILDLGGSVTEALRDSLKPYDDPCWGKTGGVLVDPTCADDSVIKSSRGGYWNSGLATTATPFRGSFTAQAPSQGLRCVYPGGSP